MKRTVLLLAFAGMLTGTAAAHHGWGSYEAAKPVTVTGPSGSADRSLMRVRSITRPEFTVTASRDPPDGPAGPRRA